MEITWLDPQQPDRRDVDGTVAVMNAARAVDIPELLRPSITSFTAGLRHGWDGDPPAVAVTRDRHGRVVAVLEVILPSWDNTHLGVVEVTVDPHRRRQGLGRQLFKTGVARVREAGRTLVLAMCFDRTAGVDFLKGMGLDQVYEQVHRRQDLVTVDWDRLDSEYAQAERHADGYELVRLPGAVPEELLDDVVRMSAAINDAPIEGLAIEDEVFSAERIRGFEAAARARQVRSYRLVARERATGDLAGHTMVEVAADTPWNAVQLDTSVLREHRGHRLGVLLKIAMLYWLREEEPQLRTLYTQNAASNAHMIRVNELLGYQAVARHTGWQRRL